MTPTRFELAHLTIVESSAKSEEELTTLESTALDQLGHSVYLLKVENTLVFRTHHPSTTTPVLFTYIHEE